MNKRTYKKASLIILLIIVCLVNSINTQAQDNRTKIKEYVGKEIQIVDNFSGQSITLIKEDKEYYIIRKFFGSGLPVVGTIKYKVKFESDYQISFSEITEKSFDSKDSIRNEDFLLSVGEKGLDLYLNRLKVTLSNN